MENKNSRLQRKLKISKQLIEELLARSDFNQRVKETRRKFKIPLRAGLKTQKKAEEWHNWLLEDEDRVQDYYQRIAKILDDCKLTERWNFFVQRYIETGDTSLTTLPKFKMHIVTDQDYKELWLTAFSTFRPGVYIQIFPDTRQEDFKDKENWKIIEIFQQRLPGYSIRQKVKKRHKRDLDFLKKTEKGRGAWDLATKIYSGTEEADDVKAYKAIATTKRAILRKRQSIKKPR